MDKRRVEYQLKEVQVSYGKYRFGLGKIMKEKNISLNQLLRETNTDFKVAKRLLDGTSISINLDVVARLCNYLKCDSSEIFEYIINQKT